MENNSMSPADIAAVVRPNAGYGGYGYGMPVMPMYPAFGYGNGFGNGFGMDGSWIWIILLLALFGGFGGGFGGFGGLGGAGLLDGGVLGYAIGNNATKGDLTSGLTNVQNGSKLDNISTQLSNGFANTSTQLCGGFADVQNAICNSTNTINTGLLTGFANSNLAAANNTASLVSAIDNSRFAQQQCCCDVKSEIANNRFADLQNTNAIQTQLAQNNFANQQCCCDIKTAIANSDNLNFRNTCAIENMIQAQTTAIKEDGEKTRSLIIANKIEELERQLAQKDRELQTANFNASQTAQTAAIRLALENQNNEFYQRLSDCPIPSQPVYGSTPIFRCNGGWNNGCGCGSQFV